jgi:phosphoribosylformylglycinamidine synthase
MTMQVGDPFMGKLLIEACLELFAADVLEGIQDMGAAGLTSSSVEMAGRAGNGIELDLDCVPRRARAMTPYEILLSESQERMLLVAKPGHEARVLEICARWDLDAAIIGRVTDTRRWVIKATPGYDPLSDTPSKPAPVVVCDLPIGVLTDDAPVYDRPRAARSANETRTVLAENAVPVPRDLAAAVLELVGSPNVGSRGWVWRQYDQIVRGGTLVRPGSDAAVVRARCEASGGRQVEKVLAFAVDCNGRMCELDPYLGGAMAIAEVCRNLVCTGAEPIGITDCLNFGNPERPEVMNQFSRAIDGIAAACTALGVPIVSGNVSLYNETGGGQAGGSRAILPTPTVAAVGLLASIDDVVTSAFKRAGCTVMLMGAVGEAACRGPRGLGGSEWLVSALGKLAGEAPLIDLAAEAKLQRLLLELARAHLLTSAHDVADGGLVATLAECCTGGEEPAYGRHGDGVGARLVLPVAESPVDAVVSLFGEAPSRVVVSTPAENAHRVEEMARAAGVPVVRIGETGGDALDVAAAPLGRFSLRVADLRKARENCLASIVGMAPT